MGVKTRGSERDRGPLSSLARGWTGDCTSMATITPTIALISLLLKWPHLFSAPGAQSGHRRPHGRGKELDAAEFFSIVESSQGQITINSEDIFKFGLEDLCPKLTSFRRRRSS